MNEPCVYIISPFCGKLLLGTPAPQQLHKFLVPHYLIITVSYKYVKHVYKFLNIACDSI